MLSRLLAVLRGIAALLGAIGLGLVVGTVLALPWAWMSRGPRERRTIRAAVVFARGVLRMLAVDDEVDGALDLDADEGAIVVCNHRSWLDPVLLIAHLRSNGLSKREIFWIPVIGVYGHLTGAVFFDRRSLKDRHRARRDVMRLVRAGCRIQVFPEGTRSRTSELRDKVYLTLPRDCYEDGIPVVTCAVWGTERVLPPDELAAHAGQRCRLRIGPTLRPEDFDDARSFAQAAWDEVAALYAALRAEEGECPERESNPHAPQGRGF